jgi:DNA-binding XRE family transcriptional regulator
VKKIVPFPKQLTFLLLSLLKFFNKTNKIMKEESLSEQLVRARLSSTQLNKSDFAMKIGISIITLNKIENPNLIEYVRFQQVLKYANAVGLKVTSVSEK